MSSLNKAMIIGRLGQDPDMRHTQNQTAVANMSVATSERYKDKQGEWQEETEWHRIVVWGKLAETCNEYLKKGSQVYFEGKIQTRKWEDNNGVTRYTTEVKAYSMTMLDKKDSGNSGGNVVPHPVAEDDGETVDLNEDFDDIDDDLPF